MSLLEILILAVVQGLTEFLPVSSSGHLVVANAALEAAGKAEAKDLVEVNIVLHVGTLLAVLVFYRRAIARLLGADRRVIAPLLVGTIPAVVIGLPIKLFFDEVLESPLLAGFMFPVTAAMLVWVSRQPEGTRDYQELSLREAAGIGLMQALALLPGISRSGSTIAGGLVAGLRREAAGTFAFLLAIPVIAGPGLIEVAEMLRDSGAEQSAGATPTPTLLVGMAVAFAVGYGALAALIQFVKQGRLAAFAWYLVPLGVTVAAWQLAR
ncbi:MAG: undecaprenyl-diphosphate phosphatase [Planctomycetota bacterium]